MWGNLLRRLTLQSERCQGAPHTGASLPVLLMPSDFPIDANLMAASSTPKDAINLCCSPFRTTASVKSIIDATLWPIFSCWHRHGPLEVSFNFA